MNELTVGSVLKCPSDKKRLRKICSVCCKRFPTESELLFHLGEFHLNHFLTHEFCNACNGFKELGSITVAPHSVVLNEDVTRFIFEKAKYDMLNKVYSKVLAFATSNPDRITIEIFFRTFDEQTDNFIDYLKNRKEKELTDLAGSEVFALNLVVSQSAMKRLLEGCKGNGKMESQEALRSKGKGKMENRPLKGSTDEEEVEALIGKGNMFRDVELFKNQNTTDQELIRRKAKGMLGIMLADEKKLLQSYGWVPNYDVSPITEEDQKWGGSKVGSGDEGKVGK